MSRQTVKNTRWTLSTTIKEKSISQKYTHTCKWNVMMGEYLKDFQDMYTVHTNTNIWIDASKVCYVYLISTLPFGFGGCVCSLVFQFLLFL